jgi:hypothetical protein
MRMRVCIAAVMASAIVLSGCGGSSHKATSSSTSAPPASEAPPPGASAGVRAVFDRVLMNGELPGFTPVGARVLGVDAASWVAKQELPPSARAAETKRLQRLGFVAAVGERLLQSGPGEVISSAVLLRSARAAREDLAYEIRQVKMRGVSGEAKPLLIPGGRGFVREGTSAVLNLLFARGPYFYRLSGRHPPGRVYSPELLELIAAGNRLYARVHS